jgi:mannose-6-phosphate isomerase-like protein (cupin superfamily)
MTSLEVRNYLFAKPDDGQSPKGSPHLFKAAASNTGGRFDFISGSFAPMSGPPLHLHHAQDDTFYILEGILTVQVGDDIFDIGPGDFLSIPPETPHTFDNLHNGSTSVRAINIMTPGGLFELFDAMADVPAGPEQAEAIQEVAARHNTAIMGPSLRVSLGLV